MRGAVSLAATLALPTATAAGAAFPERELVISLTFAVILATLVFQGLSLPLLIRRLGLNDEGASEREETQARAAGWTKREVSEAITFYQLRRVLFHAPDE